MKASVIFFTVTANARLSDWFSSVNSPEVLCDAAVAFLFFNIPNDNSLHP